MLRSYYVVHKGPYVFDSTTTCGTNINIKVHILNCSKKKFDILMTICQHGYKGFALHLCVLEPQLKFFSDLAP